MSHDMVIRGGSVIDGTGNEPVAADVAIDDGRISVVGAVEAEGRHEIDASGYAVTPGFVDIHTHLDAQIGWDPALRPVSQHGVTTALLGNCGVTFAPVKPTDHELLAGMMETVEDIPKDAIMSGLSWNWESYGEYLDMVESLNPGINVAGLVGHCALRYYVMGDRGVAEEATAEDRKKLAEVVSESIRDGAVGFSTSRFPGHYIPDGRHVPGTFAAHEELVEISEAVAAENGLMQNVLNFANFDGEMALLEKEARAGSRVLFSMGSGPDSTFSDRVMGRIAELNSEGFDLTAVSIPRGSGFLTGLQGQFLWGTPAWQELKKLKFPERLVAIKDDATRAVLTQEAKGQENQRTYSRVFWLGDADQPNYVAGGENNLEHLADAAGEHAVETWLRMALETEGKAWFTLRMFNPNLEVLEGLISSEFCLPGLGDAGAHVSQIMDSGWSSFVLSHWLRTRGLYSPGEAIRRMTSAPARIIGLEDRGTLEVGKRADVNVIDLANVGEKMPEIVYDFPGGAPRLTQGATGYKATLVNGTVMLRDDEHTGLRAGAVLRN